MREAADKLKGIGAAVETVSIPMHLLGLPIWLSVAAEGATTQMMHGNGFGFNWQGLYVTSLLDFHSNWRTRANELSETLKSTMLLGHYMTKRYRAPLLCQGAKSGATLTRGLRRRARLLRIALIGHESRSRLQRALEIEPFSILMKLAGQLFFAFNEHQRRRHLRDELSTARGRLGARRIVVKAIIHLMGTCRI